MLIGRGSEEVLPTPYGGWLQQVQGNSKYTSYPSLSGNSLLTICIIGIGVEEGEKGGDEVVCDDEDWLLNHHRTRVDNQTGLSLLGPVWM